MSVSFVQSSKTNRKERRLFASCCGLISDHYIMIEYLESMTERRLRYGLSFQIYHVSNKRIAACGVFFRYTLNATLHRLLRARWSASALSMTAHRLHPIGGRSRRPAEGGAFWPMVSVEMKHVPVSRQKRFRAKTVRSLFRCRSAGTITTVSGIIWLWTGILQMFCGRCE